MKEVKIEIVNSQLEEMGIEQSATYTPLRFAESHFAGYWISDEGRSITFYLGLQSFVCKNTQKNIELFESILQ